jgi:hypothetical protein
MLVININSYLLGIFEVTFINIMSFSFLIFKKNLKPY